jgi:hypothetical protein
MLMTKDPAAVLDYEVDWSKWLAGDGDTIFAHEVTAPTGITVDSSTRTSTAVTFWLSGGTVGQQYIVTVQITTAAGRIDERSMFFNVRDR